MLSLSINQSSDDNIDLSGLTDMACTEIPGIPHSRALFRFVDSILNRNPDELAAARELLVEEMEPEAMIDTAGIVSNFQRMTRIADSTGIPIQSWGDEDLDTMAADLEQALGIDQYVSAANSMKKP